MNYIVMDLEWNQSQNDENVVKNLPFEIIEIGAVKLNENFEMIGEYQQLICPQVYRQMHFVTQKLIHLDTEELKNGKPFRKSAEEFFVWCGDEYIFCTWGLMDLTELQRNMKYHNMKPIHDGPVIFYDVQKLFSIAFEDGILRRTLKYAADYLDIQEDIPFHRAKSDAYYTAKILNKIDKCYLQNYSYNVFELPENKKAEIHAVFDNYNKYISRGFENKTIALEDKEVISTKCCRCGRALKKKIKWFTANGRHYFCISFCPEHGYMKSKVRVMKSDEGMVYVVKTNRLITEDEMDLIKNRQQRAKQLRKDKQKRRKK